MILSGLLIKLLAIVTSIGIGIGPATVAAINVPDVFESSAIAGGVHAEIAVPAFFEAFAPYASAEASNGSSHSLNAPLYLGFFLTAAAEQFGFPPLPGTTETLYPQGPRQAGTIPTPIDGNAFESSAKSAEDGAAGRAVVARGAFAPAFDVGLGDARASVKATATGVTATSSIKMDDIDLGGGVVSIANVTGSALALATGDRANNRTEGAISISGVTIAGTPIDIPFGELGVDDSYSFGGVKIERLPDTTKLTSDGRIAEVRVGGFRFTLDAAPTAEFKLTFTIGDLIARSRAVDLPEFSEPDRGVEGPPATVGGNMNSPPTSITPISPRPIGKIDASTVITTEPVEGADWVALAALAALCAPLFLIVRRAFKAAVRP